MARIRTIKPEFWRNEQLSAISAEACLLAVGLLNHCDDEGYFNANPKLVEADVFPLRELSGKTTVLIQELVGIGYINLFSGSDGKTYGHIVSFERHQVINKKKPSIIKDLCELPYEYGTDTVAVPIGKERNGKGTGKERNGNDDADAAFDDFWNAYDKKVAKPAAEKAWKKIKPDDDLLVTILQSARRYVKSTPNKQYRKDPATWLNNQCWNDEIVENIPQKTQTQLNNEALVRSLGLDKVYGKQNFIEEVQDVAAFTPRLG